MKRALLPSLVVAGLVGASALAVAHGLADEIVGDINGQLYELSRNQARTGAVATAAAVAELTAEANTAIKLAPGNALYWDVLARVDYFPRSTATGAVVTDHEGAYAAAKAAVVRQPSSAYTWASFAYASDQLLTRGMLPGGQAALEQALNRATTLGGREPHVLRIVVDMGLANWDTIGAATRSSVQSAMRNLAVHHPADIIAIAANRGRLAQACETKRLATQKTCTTL